MLDVVLTFFDSDSISTEDITLTSGTVRKGYCVPYRPGKQFESLDINEKLTWKRAFHGTYIYALYSQVYNGKLLNSGTV